MVSVRADDYLSSGKINRDTLKVLWRSQPIYCSPYMFSGTLCAELKQRARNAIGKAGRFPGLATRIRYRSSRLRRIRPIAAKDAVST